MTLRDQILAIHQRLLADPQYARYASASRDEDAVEGLLWYDSAHMALAIRDTARSEGNRAVGAQELQTVATILNAAIGRDTETEAARRHFNDELPNRDELEHHVMATFAHMAVTDPAKFEEFCTLMRVALEDMKAGIARWKAGRS